MARIKTYKVEYLDKRILERALRKGWISQEEVNKHLASLEDVSDLAVPVETNQEEVIAERAKRRELEGRLEAEGRAKIEALKEEFTPQVITPEPSILDE